MNANVSESRDATAPLRTTGDGCLFVLGDEGVFFAAPRQELYVFNTSATFVWCCVDSGMTEDEIMERYADLFGVDRGQARADVARVLAQWWGAGYIEQPSIVPDEPLPFEAALARVIINPRLRTAFARDPQATARALNVEPAARDAFAALDPSAIDAQAHRLRRRASRRDTAVPWTDALLVTDVAGDRTALDLAVDARLRQVGTPAVERHYRMLATSVCVRYSTAAQADRVHAALAHLEVDAPAAATVTFDVVETSTGHVVLEDIVPRGYARTLDALTPIVKHLVAQSARSRCACLMEIHAGVVARGDACVLLPGPSGSGKSTLTLGLVAAGFDYMSDEIALLDETTLAVRPFPIAAAVKPGAVPVIERFRPDAASLDVHLRDDGKCVRYVTPAPRFANDVALPARWLIFPRYDQKARTALQPIAPAQALRRLLQECVSLPQLLDDTRVERLVQWMRGLECFELQMSSLDDAVAEIQRVCTS